MATAVPVMTTATASTSIVIQQEGDPLCIEELEKVSMRPQEFRLIGRFISFTYKDWKWVGLVATFTKDTMVMCNALKMSIDYFEGPYRTSIRPHQHQRSGAANGTSSATGTDESHQSAAASPPDATAAQPASTANGRGGGNSPSTADPFTHDASRARSEEKEKNLEPPKLVAFATFHRREVSNTQYASDHGQIHRSLAKEHQVSGLPHEQLIRVFIRRYIVHTAAQNNPNKILLLDFVRSRTKHSAVPHGVVEKYGIEEVATLSKVEEEIWTRRERALAARQAAMQVEDQIGGPGTAAGGPPGARTTARLLRARDGGREFMYRAGVPSRTSYVAIAHLAIAITTLLYAASAFSAVDRNLAYSYMSNMTTWVIVAAAALLLAGGASGFHGLNMEFPIKRKIPFFLRVFFLFCATGLVLSAAVGTSIIDFHYNNPVSDLSLEEYYSNQAEENPSLICAFAAKYRCSGYDTSCVDNSEQKVCVAACATSLSLLARPCGKTLRSEVDSAFLPLVIMFYISCITLLLDWITLQRFYHYGKLIGAALGVNLWGTRVQDTEPIATPQAHRRGGGGGGGDDAQQPVPS